MTSGAPYLNSKISLVSKAQIRYEGILFNIDAENATVALAKVRSFGTEDRQCDRPVPPRDDLYEYIIFRGSDIEDLTVCEPPKQPPPPKAPALPQDPAIVQSVVTSQNSAMMPPHPPPHYMHPPYGAYSMTMPPYQPHPIGHPPSNMSMPPNIPQSSDASVKPPTSVQSSSPTSSNQNVAQNSFNRTSPTLEQGVQTGKRNQNDAGRPDNMHNQSRERNQSNRGWRGRNDGANNYYNRGNNRGRGRGRGNYRYNLQNKKPLTFDGDFDFESANAQFNKEDIAKELMDKLKVTSDKKKSTDKPEGEAGDSDGNEAAHEEGEEDDDVIYYDKAKSFFDNISCETNNPKTDRISWSEERKLNTETFGTTWRGRGRGYRGNRGYRGRYNNYRGHRGGYNNSHYNNRNNENSGYRRNNWNHQNSRNNRGGNRAWVNYEYKGYTKNERGQQQAQDGKKEVQAAASS